MYSIVREITRTFYFFTAVIITVITRVRAHSFKTCGPEELANCAKPLSVLTDSGLTFVSSRADLDLICPDLKEALRCIHAYTRLCMNLHQRKHFKILFHGTGMMVTELCNNGTYQDEYLKHAPCMKKVETQNEICFEKYSQAMTEIQLKTNEKTQVLNKSTPEQYVTYQKKKREAADAGIRDVCCSFQEYVSCSTRTMRRSCGEEAAEFSRDFLDRMSSSMIKMHCSDYTPEKCGILPSSSTVISSSVKSLVALTLLSLLIR